MINSVRTTRAGWITHLERLQQMISLVRTIHLCMSPWFPMADCEKERKDKINKEFLKLQELIWESCAVTERIHRERCDKEPSFELADHDDCNGLLRQTLARLHNAAKHLERISNQLWSAHADRISTPDAVYQGNIESPKESVDQRQMNLHFNTASEPPVVDPDKIIDFKSAQANDKTNVEEDESDRDKE